MIDRFRATLIAQAMSVQVSVPQPVPELKREEAPPLETWKQKQRRLERQLKIVRIKPSPRKK